MTKPKLSVIIIAYNLEKYIGECLQSVYKQSYRDFETIIIDDGSKDGTSSVISRFIQENDPVGWRYIQKPNGGAPSARNMGLDLAEGEWVAFIDGDDMIAEDYLAVMMSAAEEKQVDLVVTGWFGMNDVDGTIAYKRTLPVHTEKMGGGGKNPLCVWFGLGKSLQTVLDRRTAYSLSENEVGRGRCV